MNIKQHIPNAFTLLNLFCGCCGIVFCLQKQYCFIPILIFVALLADFLDGFLARLLNVKSDLGAQLDSLADMTTFGILPSVMFLVILQENFKVEHLFSLSSRFNLLVSFVSVLYAIAAALRLAKFNIDTRQTVNFIGVPTPAAAMFVLGLYCNYFFGNPLFISIYNSFVLIGFILSISFLMISELPLFSFKKNPLNYKENKVSFIFLLLCIPQPFIFKWLSFSTVIITYILLNILDNKKRN